MSHHTRWRAVLAASSILALSTLGAGVVTQSASADSFTFQVTNYDQDGTHGVYLRNSSDINDVTRDGAHYLLYTTSIELVCAEWGSPVGPYQNTAWDEVQVLTGPNAGRVGHLSEHWLNTPVGPNQHVPGEPACGSSSQHATAAMSWANAQIGSTAWNGLCLSFVRNAYLAGGDDLRSQVSVSWDGSTYPQDIWSHFTAGTTGSGTPPAGALVFYLAKSGYSKIYSHVTIAVDGNSDTVSTPDSVNHSAVHTETINQHSQSGAYNYYVGWWLPN